MLNSQYRRDVIRRRQSLIHMRIHGRQRCNLTSNKLLIWRGHKFLSIIEEALTSKREDYHPKSSYKMYAHV